MPTCHSKQKPAYMILLHFINVKIPKHCLMVYVKNRSDAGIKKIITYAFHISDYSYKYRCVLCGSSQT